MADDGEGRGLARDRPRGTPTRRRRAWIAVVAAAALALPLVVLQAGPAAAAEWGIQKQVLTPGPYAPGDTVEFVVSVSCSDPNAQPCTAATVTDDLPDGLQVVSATITQGPSGGTVDTDTAANTVTASWPTVANGAQAQVTVTARIDPDLPFSASGQPITNTATVDADNTNPASSSASITPTVPLVLDSETTKTITPDGALAAPGTAATMTIGSTNTSNDPVDELVVQDPADPTATPNPFTLLQYTGVGTITFPPNADTVTQEYWDGSSWQPLDDTVDPAAVQGVRYTFSGDIQPGATASVPVHVEQSDAVTDLTDTTTVTNTASSHVVHGTDESDPTTASDTYVITPPNTSVTASKSFDPSTVSAGEPTTVTVGATTTGTAVDTMTIAEPAPGTPSPFEGDDALTFTGFGPSGDGTGVQWPTGASAATVTFTCADGSTPALDATAPDTLPDPPAGCTVVGFEVEFTGDMPTGAAASVPFTADTDPDQTTRDVTHANEIEATVPNANDTASADLVTLVDRLATDTSKTISPSTLPAVPGQSVVVQLPTRLAPFGPDGSTTSASQVVVQDPTDPANPGSFWDSFTATSVRTTDVPAGSTLTVNYWDGTAWVPAPGCGPFTGPDTVSCDLPDGAQGVQFVYDSDTGFPPGTSFQPNFTAAYDGPTGADDPVENCGASSASAATVAPTTPAEGCATVDPFPVNGGGNLSFIDKQFLGPQPVSVLARSDGQVTGQITWSTNGFSGVDPMVISDVADPATTAIGDSFYDAFDLVRVDPITTAQDPLIGYDAVQSVELFIGGAWVEATGDPCPSACDGSFPGYTLTAAERAAATSVRLTYVESPTRAATTDPTEPQPGDGVARSTQADGRHLLLTFQVRDERRSDGGPVLGSTHGTLYNTTDPGVVENTARGDATFDGQVYTDTAADTVLIIDQPLNVSVTKDWTGGPVSVPPAGTPAEFFPTTNVTITGTNASAAKVDELRLVEPGAAGTGDVQTASGTSPFDAFTLRSIAITPPAGTDTTTVTLTAAGGSTQTYSEAQAEALTPDDLAPVVGVEVAFDGLVQPAASGSMTLVLQLRRLDRYTLAPVTVDAYSPVPDGAVATIADPGGVTGQDVRTAFDDASMPLQSAAIGLVVGKSFSPTQVVEPSTGPVTMTLTGQPQGPSRAVSMQLVDDDPQFWNQYDMVGFGAGAALVTPIQQVQVDAYVGGTFSAGPGGVVVTGGSWVLGTPSASFALPAQVDASDVQGLRFTFSRTDGSIWENPATPTQPVPITVERRSDLRTGGPVLPDLAANAPAPGETAPGVASNEVRGTVTGADLVVDPDTGEQVPVTASDSAPAQLTYVHATNAVTVTKAFDGIVSGDTEAPDAVFPMTVSLTNTGARAIVDPVVDDAPMPADLQGAQLRLADASALPPGVDPFSYTLTGAAPTPASGPALPTDAAAVTVDQVGDLLGLRFSFPPGSVLEVGQTYTITVMVQFRLGLAPQTVVRNTVDVTGDRPWDTCLARLDPTTGACEADADVRPVGAAVLTQSKLVKATDDDQLGVIVDPAAPDPDVACTPDADGFYAYPCTPVVPPGHDETWHIAVSNVGNLPMNKLVVYDRLPAVGDTGSFASSARGSQWTPFLTDDPPPTLVNAPPGSTGAFYYTTVDDYCMDDLTNPLAEPCPSDDPTTGWVRLTGGESQDVLRTVTALKFVITFPAGALFDPGETVAIEGTTTTPPVPPAAGDHAIAWNSAAASGVVVTAQGDLNLLPTEGTKVGVATATGPVQVVKQVTGAGRAYAPAEFHLQLDCTSAVGTWVETDLPPVAVTVTAGTPVTVPDLPYGATCTLREDSGAGETTFSSTTVTVGEDPDAVIVTAVNDYELADLSIDKAVVSDAVDQDGQPVPFGPFDVSVACTFLGEPVYADGYGPANPMDLTIDGGETVTLEGLPVGSECTVSETGAGNAATVTVTVTQDGGTPVVTTGTSASLTLVRQPGAVATNDVTLTNVFDVGELDLTKVVTGDGADRYGAGPFRLAVTCTFDDGSGQVRTVYDSTVVLGGAGPLHAEIPDLPTGAVCDVTEPSSHGATSATVTTASGGPLPVTIGDGDAVDVVATNTFDVGSVLVDKVVTGDGAALYGDGPFSVTLTCRYQGASVPIPGGATRPLVPGTPVRYDDLPVGATCLVRESDDGDATSTTISTAGVVRVGDDPATVTLTNRFDLGSLAVDKDVTGDGARLYGGGPFTVALACSFDGAAIDIPGGAERALTPGTPVVYDDLPVGAACTVTETATGGATSSTVVSVDGRDGSVVVPPGDPGQVTVTNEFDVGEIRVVKTLDGPDAAAASDDVFTVSLACTRDVDGRTVPVDIPGGPTRTLSAAGGWVATYTDLPQGATCVLSETDAGDAGSVEIVVDGTGATTDPTAEVPRSTSFAVPVGDDVCVPVDAVNTFGATGTATAAGAGGGRFAVTLAGPLTASPVAALPALGTGCGDPGGGVLAATGADTGPAGLAALALLVLGGALVLAARRAGRTH